MEVRSRWKDKLYQMSREDRRFTYQDLLSGNLSLDAELFACLDGFDSAFANCGGEDYEFGLRLLKADVSLVLTAEAVGYHYEHETNNLDRSFGRSRQEGRSDVSSGRRHPELGPTLHIKDYETPYFLVDKILVAIPFGIASLHAFLWPTVVDGLAVGARKCLDLLESLGMQEGGGCGLSLRGYWYLRV
ncbi:galactosyltransferase-related protein [Microcoleus sp. herbarium2]|uniref:galactosyltransferase-related protein n=1 Tax=Microcoleus sp. herbarium2 TaxID=3055433 RepID=UPI002FD65B78